MDNRNIEKLIKFINESDNIVFFGGAGVSTESGIPDFRSKDGLYNQKDVRFEQFTPEYLLSKECLNHNPRVFFEFYRQKMDTREYEPNMAHKFLKTLEDLGKLKGIVTQNIDGLHQKAGSTHVYEIHGTTSKNYCCKCNKTYDVNYIFDDNNIRNGIPRCECRGIVRPDVTLYGEKLPINIVDMAIDRIKNADMLIIAGTSLTVYPAAMYVNEFRGEHIVIINRDEISFTLDEENDLFIQGSVGEIFAKVNELMN